MGKHSHKDHHHHHHHDHNSTNLFGLLPIFKRLSPGVTIRVVTDSGDIITGTFIRLVGDPYIEISVPGTLSPFVEGEVVFVDVTKIESLSFVS
ncbi:hypothetical protein PU629_12525 [Pullulanibacillus sp. KACC 23026]|uniref:hypothetical protein n=1 Tax=Pullulanibacillus sp. KACC 23026 TaxID=3028315 RepID=UPI0023B0BCEB|nr:hypothetical protein [Pullulanibacillus sp. KACC 23026]WEG11002.1 hypothetical protein PU629_12525 [Pullulanibacillus sp. KACC 23026]